MGNFLRRHLERAAGAHLDLRSERGYRYGGRARRIGSALGVVVSLVTVGSLGLTAVAELAREFPVTLTYCGDIGFFVSKVDDAKGDPGLLGARVVAIEGVRVDLQSLAGDTAKGWLSARGEDGRIGKDSIRSAIRGRSNVRMTVLRDPHRSPPRDGWCNAVAGVKTADEGTDAWRSSTPEAVVIRRTAPPDWYLAGAELLLAVFMLAAGPAVLLAARARAAATWAGAVLAAGAAVGLLAAGFAIDYLSLLRHPFARSALDLQSMESGWPILGGLAGLAFALFRLLRRTGVSPLPPRRTWLQWLGWMVAGAGAVAAFRLADSGGFWAVVDESPAWFGVPLLMLATLLLALILSLAVAVFVPLVLPIVTVYQRAGERAAELDDSDGRWPLVGSFRLASGIALVTAAVGLMVLSALLLPMVTDLEAGDTGFMFLMSVFSGGAPPALLLLGVSLPFLIPILGACLSLSDRLRWSTDDLLRRTTVVSVLAAGAVHFGSALENLLPETMQNDVLQGGASLFAVVLLSGPLSVLARRVVGESTVHFDERLRALSHRLGSSDPTRFPSRWLGEALAETFGAASVAVLAPGGEGWRQGGIPAAADMAGAGPHLERYGSALVLTDGGPLLALPVGPAGRALVLLGSRNDGQFYTREERRRIALLLSPTAPLFGARGGGFDRTSGSHPGGTGPAA